MQDIQSMGGGGGRIFGGGGDRRLRPHHHSNHQVLKCPRCDSLNTKFCYYNNYNLSQPRHFCKSCRRYWTRGGVLRNVPVGGGCRKAKRSSKPKPLNSHTTAAAPPPEQNKSNSHSSSESSSLTANNTATAAAEPQFRVPESKALMVEQTTNPRFEQAQDLPLGSDCGIFSEIGSFSNLITSSNDPLLYGLNNVADISQFRMNYEQQQQKMMSMDMDGGDDDAKIQEITCGLLDQTVQAELTALQSKSTDVGFGSLDWPSGGSNQGLSGGSNQGLFDLPNTVDQTYWSHTQWDDQDHPNLYLR